MHNLNEAQINVYDPVLSSDDDDDDEGPKYLLENVDDLILYVEKIIDEDHEPNEVDEPKWIKVKETIQQIFTLSKNINKISKNQDNNLSKLTKYFPNESTVNSILNNLKTDSFIKTSNKLLIFPIKRNNLTEIVENISQSNSKELFEIYTFYTFYTWISAIVFLFKGSKKIDFTVLLTILNSIIKITKNNSKSAKIYSTASSCFINLINISIDLDSFHSCTLLFKEVDEYFNIFENQSDTLNELIRNFIPKIFIQEEKLSKQELEFVDFISNILTKNQQVIDKSIFQSIIELTKKYITYLNPMCLRLFLLSADYVEKFYFFSILQLTLVNTLARATDSEDDEINDDRKERNDDIVKLELTYDEFINSDFFHPPHDLYQINFNSDLEVFVNLNPPGLSSFISNELYPVVSIIEEIITLKEENAQYFISEAINIVQILNSKYEKNEISYLSKQIFYQQYSIILYWLSSVIKKFTNIISEDSIKEKSILFNNKILFDPRITFYSHDIGFNNINSLRGYIFQFLLEKCPDLIDQILNEEYSFLFLFRESINRIYSIRNNELFHTKNSSIAETLIISLVCYRDMGETLNKDDNNYIYKILFRKLCLLNLDSIFEDDDILKQLFTSSFFVKFYLISIIEPPIRHKLTKYLIKFLTELDISNQDNNSIIQFICQKINDLFIVSLKELPLNEAISVISDVIGSINEVIMNNPQLKEKSNLSLPLFSH